MIQSKTKPSKPFEQETAPASGRTAATGVLYGNHIRRTDIHFIELPI